MMCYIPCVMMNFPMQGVIMGITVASTELLQGVTPLWCKLLPKYMIIVFG